MTKTEKGHGNAVKIIKDINPKFGTLRN